MENPLERYNSVLQAVIGNNNVLGEFSFPTFLLLACTSLVASLFVGYLYLTFYQKKASGMHIYRAFPLLGISITSIFICVQFSLSLSLGLLGALSIVRFRTPVKEPEEIGFIMLLIAVSISIATFNFYYLAAILAVSTAGLYLMNRYLAAYRSPAMSGVLLVTLNSSEASDTTDSIEEFLPNLLLRPRCENVNENEQGVTLCYRFDGIQTTSISKLREELTSRFTTRDLKIFSSE